MTNASLKRKTKHTTFEYDYWSDNGDDSTYDSDDSINYSNSRVVKKRTSSPCRRKQTRNTTGRAKTSEGSSSESVPFLIQTSDTRDSSDSCQFEVVSDNNDSNAAAGEENYTIEAEEDHAGMSYCRHD